MPSSFVIFVMLRLLFRFFKRTVFPGLFDINVRLSNSGEKKAFFQVLLREISKSRETELKQVIDKK